MELSGVVLSEDAADMQIQANSSEKGVSNRLASLAGPGARGQGPGVGRLVPEIP
jgi:hypothetical protein